MPEPVTLGLALAGLHTALSTGGASVGAGLGGASVGTTVVVGTLGAAAIMCHTCKAVKHGHEAKKCRDKCHKLERQAEEDRARRNEV